MADENKAQFRSAQNRRNEPEAEEEQSSKHDGEGGKGHLLVEHYKKTYPHEDIPEVIATSTVSEGLYIVTLQGPHGPYHAILIRDKHGSTLIGKQ